jgi:hypothetical protein
MNTKESLLKGIYYDRIITAGGKIIGSGWHSNIIVDRCRMLLAAFITRDKLRAKGVKFLFIGKGDESWDIKPPPPPLRSVEQLVDINPFKIPVKRKMIKYLDAAGNPTEGPTHRIQITVTLDPGTPPPIENNGKTYPLREFGLFGEFDNKEYMIDYVRHPVIHKAADDTMVRTIRLIF